MRPLDKFLLLGSLTFFFAMLAISLVSNLYKSKTPSSYIYVPPASEAAPLADAASQFAPVAKSVLHYPAAPQEVKSEVVCHLEPAYNKIITDMASAGSKIVATAVIGGDRLEIYAAPDGAFSAYVIGPDAIGQVEACEVAAGSGWTVTAP